MVNYAHRGASEYAPENTMSAFYLGLLQGADGIETDIQRTLDGKLVLFHDKTLERVTVGKASGCVSDYTLNELRELKIYGNCATGFYDKIPTLEQFLSVFCGYKIRFALELKTPDAEKEVLSLINKYRVVSRVTITSFEYDFIKMVRELCSYVRIGWLVNGDGLESTSQLSAIKGEEMCPKASETTEQSVKTLKDSGFCVRAWGVNNTEQMTRMCRLGVDGMTVNFPDRLCQYLALNNREI